MADDSNYPTEDQRRLNEKLDALIKRGIISEGSGQKGSGDASPCSPEFDLECRIERGATFNSFPDGAPPGFVNERFKPQDIVPKGRGGR